MCRFFVSAQKNVLLQIVFSKKMCYADIKYNVTIQLHKGFLLENLYAAETTMSARAGAMRKAVYENEAECNAELDSMEK